MNDGIEPKPKTDNWRNRSSGMVSALCPNNERLACHLFVYLLIEMVPGLKEEILSWPIMKETS